MIVIDHWKLPFRNWRVDCFFCPFFTRWFFVYWFIEFQKLVAGGLQQGQSWFYWTKRHTTFHFWRSSPYDIWAGVYYSRNLDTRNEEFESLSHSYAALATTLSILSVLYQFIFEKTPGFANRFRTRLISILNQSWIARIYYLNTLLIYWGGRDVMNIWSANDFFPTCCKPIWIGNRNFEIPHHIYQSSIYTCVDVGSSNAWTLTGDLFSFCFLFSFFFLLLLLLLLILLFL